MEPTIQCNQLLLQAPQIIADFKRVARIYSPPDARKSVADAYLAWYAAGQRVILGDLRTRFESRYTTGIGGYLSIQDMLARLLDFKVEKVDPFNNLQFLAAAADAMQRWSSLSQQSEGFQWAVEEQCELLHMTRREIFPRRHQISYEVRFAIATICKRLYRGLNVDRLFTNNGCLPTWWVPPLQPVDSERMTSAMGWFDGIVLFVPERELAITRAICQEILRKPRLAQGMREEVAGILQQLAPSGAAPAPLAPDDGLTQQRLNLLAIHRATLLFELVRLARVGIAHAQPEIMHGIREARTSIARIKATLRTSGVAVEDQPEDKEEP